MGTLAAIEWGALGRAALYAFAATLVVTALFTSGVLLVEPRGGRAAPALQRAGGAVLLLGCALLVVYGIHVLLTTK